MSQDVAGLDRPPPNPSDDRRHSEIAEQSARTRRVDQPRAGTFTIKLVRGGPRVPARIHFDFGQFWAEIDGRIAGAAHEDPIQADGVMRIWHYGQEIEWAEYGRLLRRENPPDPRKPVDFLTSKPIY